jgi:hypothetical protein
VTDDFRQIGDITVRCYVCGTFWMWPVTTGDDPVIPDDDCAALDDHFEQCERKGDK